MSRIGYTINVLLFLDPTWPDNDFLGYDPPPVTAYTGMSTRYYSLVFVILLVVHILTLMALKSKVSPDFQELNWLDKFLHSIESTNFPFAVNDWDLPKVGGVNEYYERMRNVRLEVVCNVAINLIFNCCLLTPLIYLCKYCTIFSYPHPFALA